MGVLEKSGILRKISYHLPVNYYCIQYMYITVKIKLTIEIINMAKSKDDPRKKAHNRAVNKDNLGQNYLLFKVVKYIQSNLNQFHISSYLLMPSCFCILFQHHILMPQALSTVNEERVVPKVVMHGGHSYPPR